MINWLIDPSGTASVQVQQTLISMTDKMKIEDKQLYGTKQRHMTFLHSTDACTDFSPPTKKKKSRGYSTTVFSLIVPWMGREFDKHRMVANNAIHKLSLNTISFSELCGR